MAEGYKDKLVATKQAWARAGRLVTGKAGDPEHDRLPPGQRLVENWPVLDLGVQPAIALADWQLTVDGLVANPLTWTYAELLAQPQTEDTSDIHCVTQWSRYDNNWTGVTTQHLLNLVKPLPSAAHLVLHAYDGYTTNVTLEQFSDDDCLIAHTHDGAPLSREHGGPVRLVIPRYYLWKSAKWLKRIEFVGADRPGFWENRGYHNFADPWLEQRYG
ncbi:sulfite oxidase-like oxidoreductase [Glacieibacterium frigidum]|uniref:Sulfite oxidase-like oxidoreductase n=1 Tax=Glacieibacterium frigidum TaxID=2593303 RepID=A0A552UHX8_9SPHN|nr:sulfite oxidase-like oxidoreductase [Glacieibacterium frigidum]TRW17823.1 sulfite oxidase-like oxidoreductase [Glacieibacterium frigidum]